MVASWDNIGAQLNRWTMTMELRYAVSWPSLEQLSLVRVQFETISGHPATNIHDALLEPSGCRGDVFTAAMRVIGKRVKSDTVSVDNVRKVNHVQHQQYWAKDWALWHRADDVHNRWGTTGVHESVCPTGQVWTKPHQSCSTQTKLMLKSQQ